VIDRRLPRFTSLLFQPEIPLRNCISIDIFNCQHILLATISTSPVLYVNVTRAWIFASIAPSSHHEDFFWTMTAYGVQQHLALSYSTRRSRHPQWHTGTLNHEMILQWKGILHGTALYSFLSMVGWELAVGRQLFCMEDWLAMGSSFTARARTVHDLVARQFECQCNIVLGGLFRLFYLHILLSLSDQSPNKQINLDTNLPSSLLCCREFCGAVVHNILRLHVNHA
jgi:hypothetical protein